MRNWIISFWQGYPGLTGKPGVSGAKGQQVSNTSCSVYLRSLSFSEASYVVGKLGEGRPVPRSSIIGTS